MEKLSHPWSARVPAGHMHLLMTFTVVYDEDVHKNLSSENSFKDSGISLSPELKEFISQCSSSVDVRRDFTIRFSSIEDYTRFKLLEFNEHKV